jgi:hypothetical protein
MNWYKISQQQTSCWLYLANMAGDTSGWESGDTGYPAGDCGEALSINFFRPYSEIRILPAQIISYLEQLLSGQNIMAFGQYRFWSYHECSYKGDIYVSVPCEKTEEIQEYLKAYESISISASTPEPREERRRKGKLLAVQFQFTNFKDMFSQIETRLACTFGTSEMLPDKFETSEQWWQERIDKAKEKIAPPPPTERRWWENKDKTDNTP